VSAPADLRERDERLQALKSLAGRLAHDFNNSLTPLIGYISLLEEQATLPSSNGQYLARMDRSVRRTQDLIKTIMEATYPERHFLPKTTDLTALLVRTTEPWMKALPATAQVAVETDLVQCSLFLDENQWTNVIQQLLRNAQFAMAGGGSLKLSLRLRTITPDHAAALGITDTGVFEFVFEDTGCGMSGEVLARACDPFFTTRSRTATSGLGLTLVHSVVHLHGGQLAIESVEGAGTRVTIWLPAKAD
jgi:signal transduction histidine kinase